MIQAPNLPTWAAIVVSVLVLAGALITLTGTIGLLRMKTFYDRLHPPTLGSSAGTLLIVAASVLCFTILRSRISVHEILIALFMTLTTPVTFILLARAALYRDRAAGNEDVPPDGRPPAPPSEKTEL
jgi:multicomponent K+:H+ antiporter subunit G